MAVRGEVSASQGPLLGGLCAGRMPVSSLSSAILSHMKAISSVGPPPPRGLPGERPPAVCWVSRAPVPAAGSGLGGR